MSEDFIGRGEKRTVEILCKLFPTSQIRQQVPIKNLISEDSWKKLGEEHRKHKHDIVILTSEKDIVIEVNYKHGSKAHDKWQVYKAYLEDAGCKCVTIDDNECLTLFQLRNGEHDDCWQDWIDVIRALEKAGVNSQ